jgi:hypothetical protein
LKEPGEEGRPRSTSLQAVKKDKEKELDGEVKLRNISLRIARKGKLPEPVKAESILTCEILEGGNKLNFGAPKNCESFVRRFHKENFKKSQ